MDPVASSAGIDMPMILWHRAEEVILSVEHRSQLIDMARTALPNEMCALIGGTSASPMRVATIVGVKNSAASPTTFALEGSEMLAAEDRIEHAGLEVIAIAHSHPASEAIPSATDVAEASIYDPTNALVHFIVSMQGFAPTLLAWRFSGNTTSPSATSVAIAPSS